MKSQAITEYGAALEPVESETPQPSGSEVLVEISHCGVCHSDVHFHDGHFDMGGGNKLDVRGARQTPFTLGHEIEGTVIAIGDEVKDVKVGDRRVVYPWIGCGDCNDCNNGRENLCNGRAWALISQAVFRPIVWCHMSAIALMRVTLRRVWPALICARASPPIQR